MRFANLDGRLVVLDADRHVDVAAASGGRFSDDPGTMFEHWDELLGWARDLDLASGRPYDPADLGAPVPRPGQVFAIALNYAPHAVEAGYRPPAAPLVFTKFPACITGPGGVVELPPGNVDWELELVVVIARDCHHVALADAWDVVAGLTVGQDLSERRLQMAGSPAQFSLGKSFPGFGPIGPALVTADEVPDRDDLDLTCSLGDLVVQHARTSEMIFSVSELIVYLSAVCPLRPGDLIFTGTPAGVGNRRSPQRFITAQDELVSTISGLGTMRHRFANSVPSQRGQFSLHTGVN